MLRVEPYEPDVVALLEEGLNLPNLIARLLAIRGLATVEEAERFLYPRLEHLSDPFLLPDIGPAIETMQDAIVSGRKIGVFGDYDADGVTSTALLVDFLEKVGIKPEVYLPARDEGYGLNETAVKALHDKGVTLLVCLDCGSSSFAELETATRLGMEAIILDHHEVPEPRPHPRALVNPKRKDARFPTRELAACGVTFFFLLALRRSLHASGLLERPINLKREMDLVAIGTVGDMVPLTGDNRILVKFGIEQMQKAPRTWLKSFLKQNLLFRQAVDGYGLSFVIIPRINAAGRVSHPRMAFDFLKATEENESNRLLSELNRSNRMRQELEESIVREAQGKIDEEKLSEGRTLVLAKEDWPIGVIGIAAQKLAESHGKPCIICTRVDGIWKGSARGVAGLDLHAAINEVSSLLIRFGGHKRACGLSVTGENLAYLPAAFEDAVKRCLPDAERIQFVDAAVDFDEITMELVEQTDLLGPFGFGNPRPSFLLEPLSVTVNKRFVKLTDRKKRTWHGSSFKKGPIPDGPELKVIACPTMREDLGEKFIHFQVRDILAE